MSDPSKQKTDKQSRCAVAPGSPLSPAYCPGCGTGSTLFPFGQQGNRREYAVLCDRPDCWRGPIGVSARQAVELWNRVAWYRPITISPLAESKNLGTTSTLESPKGVALAGDETAGSSDASGELDFTGGVSFSANK